MNLFLDIFDPNEDEDFSAQVFYEFCDFELCKMNKIFKPNLHLNEDRFRSFSTLAFESFLKVREAKK